MQNKLQSFYEACVNILIGFSINFVANMIILPWFGFNITLGDNLIIGAIYTLISLARSYVIRRVFNKKVSVNK